MRTSRSKRRMGRRGFLGITAATGGAAAAGGLFEALVARRARALTPQACDTGAYGPLKYRPPEDNGLNALLGGAPVMMVPEAFRYAVVSIGGRMMADGYPVPHAFDGMCAIPGPKGIRLIRNHEDRDSGSAYKTGFLSPTRLSKRPVAGYDDFALGGCTALDIAISKNGVPENAGEHWALVGTTVNCAGGLTPWGTWITCEETIAASSSSGFTEHHGYCFEVAANTSPGHPTTPVALTRLGRMNHEAVAVDPATGFVYETEDNGSSSGVGGDCGFYRWEPPAGLIPGAFGDLAAMQTGSTLKMLKVRGVDNERLYEDKIPGTTYSCDWVTIPEPNPVPIVFHDPDPAISNNTSTPRTTVNSPYWQGRLAGGAIFKKLEGCWYDPRTKKVFFVASGDAGYGLGQVWSYDTVATENQLELIYAPNNVTELDNPDNICVSPRGGLVLCEDSGGAQFLRGLTTDGRVFDLARNVFSGNELAGACFSPDGKYLFVNIMGRTSVRAVGPYGTSNNRLTNVVLGPDQSEVSLTIAIWGPWANGCL